KKTLTDSPGKMFLYLAGSMVGCIFLISPSLGNGNYPERKIPKGEMAELAMVNISKGPADSRKARSEVRRKVVSSSDGQGIPGASSLIKGTDAGTVTDVNGAYTLEVSDEDGILVFSSIGYISQEVSVNGRSVIDITLVEDVQSL